MVADVPVGAFLSRGVDSSCIVALMKRHTTTRVKTFSLGFRRKAIQRTFRRPCRRTGISTPNITNWNSTVSILCQTLRTLVYHL